MLIVFVAQLSTIQAKDATTPKEIVTGTTAKRILETLKSSAESFQSKSAIITSKKPLASSKAPEANSVETESSKSYPINVSTTRKSL